MEEIVKTILLNDTAAAIFDRYLTLQYELRTLMPEDAEGRAQISGEMAGIKWVVDLLSRTSFF